MPTIKDVAKKAGVSYGTVSKVLNNYGTINKETAKKVMRVIEEMNYVPNRVAQNLVTRTNKTMAIIVSGLEEGGGKDNITFNILSGVYSYANKEDYPVAVFATSPEMQKKKSYIQFCRENNFAGAILHGIRTDDQYFRELLDSQIPCVVIDIPTPGKNTSSISVDNIAASEEAVDLLIKNNHRNIAYVHGRNEAVVALERYNGYVSSLKKHGIIFNEDYVIFGEFLEDIAYENTKVFLQKHPEVTAFFCASDMMALGVMKAAKELGKKLPNDLSIIGFDDIPLSEYTTPRLTTVSQNMFEMGKKAAELLIELINDEKKNGKHVYLNHKIVARDSICML